MIMVLLLITAIFTIILQKVNHNTHNVNCNVNYNALDDKTIQNNNNEDYDNRSDDSFMNIHYRDNYHLSNGNATKIVDHNTGIKIKIIKNTTVSTMTIKLLVKIRQIILLSKRGQLMSRMSDWCQDEEMMSEVKRSYTHIYCEMCFFFIIIFTAMRPCLASDFGFVICFCFVFIITVRFCFVCWFRYFDVYKIIHLFVHS